MTRSQTRKVVTSVAACVLALLFSGQDLGQAGGLQTGDDPPVVVQAVAVKTVVGQAVVVQEVIVKAVVVKAVVGIVGVPSYRALQPGGGPDEVLPGACSRGDRSIYLHASSARFRQKMRTCSQTTWADRKDNTACLIMSMPMLSTSCATCFAVMASCAYAHCKMACMFDSASKRCLDCANAHCQAELVQCTGIARADLP
jgi:hypothetical protein